jgi:hypothetical protein
LATVVVRLLAALTALVFAGGIASAAGRLGDDEAESAEDTLVSGGAVLSPRGGIGPLPGTIVAAYVRSREDALVEVTSRRTAVVSFDGYRTPEQSVRLVAGVEATSLLIALRGGRPVEAAVGEDLAALVKRQRDDAAAEKRALEQLLPTVSEPDFRAQYEADIGHLGALLARPSDERDIVYAVVVVGTGDALRDVAARDGVRLVDVGSDADRPTRGAAAGLRPEETAEAGEPPNRPTG